jgi:predicted transcriptional regulator
MSDVDDDPKVQLPERVRVSVTADGDEFVSGTVHCPAHGAARSLEHCRACVRFVRESGREVAMLECHVPAAVTAPRGVVGELVSRVSVCLDGELGVEEAARLLEGAHVNAAPVVDDNQVVVGLVTSKSLDRARLEDAQLRGFQRGHTSEVEDAMTRELFTVAEDVPVVDAARLMAERKLTSLTVVNARGEVVGSVEVHAVLAALVERLTGAK